jgi:hypothetical protein
MPKARLRVATRTVLLATAICGMAGRSRGARAQDISLEIHTKDGRSEYHVGEPIDLRLVFSSPNKQYLVDSSLSYPDFEPARDEFLLESKGGSEDPLDDYRRVMSDSENFVRYEGMRVVARLRDKPVVLDIPLNRYVRFTKPGRYVLKVSSRRVSQVRTSFEEPQVIEISSKPLRLTIVAADDDWKKEQLNLALEGLKERPGVKVSACRLLESLGTPESEVAMADALEDEYEAIGCGFGFALLGARNRKIVLKHMETKLQDPSGQITTQFVDAMATLKTLEAGEETEFNQRVSEARGTFADELFAALDQKKGAARMAAISTLVNESLMAPAGGSPGRNPQVLRMAAEVFEHLNSQAQSTLLSAQWNQVASPAMVSILRRCAEAASTETCGQVQSDLLLARLNELSPRDAREVILADMLSENPRFPAQAASLLPEHELPELDGVLREHLVNKSGNLDTTAGLIHRYASGGLSGAVLEFLKENEPGKMGGQIEANLIAYLFRVQPDMAEQKLREALAAREETANYKYLLREVAQRAQDAKLQEIAIRSLGDPDRDVVQSAVEALGIVGDEQAKAALFERLQQWRASWMGRQQEMSSWMVGDGPIEDDRYLGAELIQTIAKGAGWLLTREDQQRLMAGALTENEKQQAAQFVEQANARPVTVLVMNTGWPNFQVVAAQYGFDSVPRLKTKLSQFTAGTSFAMQCGTPESAETKEVVAEIKTFLVQKGMRVEDCKSE